MTTQILNFAPELSYLPPDMYDQTSRNMVKFRPRESSFVGGQNIEVQVESNTEYIDLQRSFITFDVATTVPSPTTGVAQLSSLGGGIFLSGLSETIYGKALPQIQNVPLIYQTDFITDSEKRQKLHNKSSYFIPLVTAGSTFTTGLTAVDEATAISATRMCLPMIGHLKSANAPIPLPDINGGIVYNFSLNSTAKCFTAGLPASYVITNFAIVGNMLRPSDQYLIEHQDFLAKGRSLDLGLQMVNTSTIPLVTTSGVNTQTVRVQSGYKKSLNSVILDVRSADTFEAVSVIKDHINDLYYTVGTERYPRNFSIDLTKKDNVWTSMGITSVFDDNVNFNDLFTTQGFHIQNFKSNQTAMFSGIPIEGGQFEANITFKDATTVGVANVVLFYDGLLKITANGCEVFI